MPAALEALNRTAADLARTHDHPDTLSNAEMGDLFEELIRKFADASNETAGEHFTPREVIRLMVNLLFIEDDDQIRLALRLALEDEGYTVAEAARAVCSDMADSVGRPVARPEAPSADFVNKGTWSVACGCGPVPPTHTRGHGGQAAFQRGRLVCHGPLQGLKLQAEGHDVRYRNAWIKELDLTKADTDFSE